MIIVRDWETRIEFQTLDNQMLPKRDSSSGEKYQATLALRPNTKLRNLFIKVRGKSETGTKDSSGEHM